MGENIAKGRREQDRRDQAPQDRAEIGLDQQDEGQGYEQYQGEEAAFLEAKPSRVLCRHAGGTLALIVR